jgi:hypothetical protein
MMMKMYSHPDFRRKSEELRGIKSQIDEFVQRGNEDYP